MSSAVSRFCYLPLLFCCALLSACASRGLPPLSAEQARHDFEQAAAVVQKSYVDEVALPRLVDGAVAGMYRYLGETPPLADISSEAPLDRFTRVYESLRDHRPPKAMMAAEPPHGAESPVPDRIGIGLVLIEENKWIRIGTVEIGSAAEAAGLDRGAALIAIDGQATAGQPLSWCYQRLSGAPGSVVEVSVRTEAGEELDYRVVRRPNRAPAVAMAAPSRRRA